MEARTLDSGSSDSEGEARERGFQQGSGGRPKEGDGVQRRALGMRHGLLEGHAKEISKGHCKGGVCGLWTVPNSKGLGWCQGGRGVHGGNRQRKEAVAGHP